MASSLRPRSWGFSMATIGMFDTRGASNALLISQQFLDGSLLLAGVTSPLSSKLYLGPWSRFVMIADLIS